MKEKQEDQTCENTDNHLFYDDDNIGYSSSCHMTKNKTLGINVGGYVIVKTLREWHNLANIDFRKNKNKNEKET